jgi:hypothetical protein
LKLEIIQEFLISQGYEKTQYFRKNNENILPFENIFINNDKTELYLIEEKEVPFNKEEIEVFENNILAFIQLLPNRSPLKYNINLILLCPLKTESVDKADVKFLVGLERNKYTCRKIVLDTSYSNEIFIKKELSLLPSFPIRVDLPQSTSVRDRLAEEIKKVIPQNLYIELIKENEDMNMNTVLNLLEIREEKSDE